MNTPKRPIPSPYDLRDAQGSSSAFYSVLATFADQLSAMGEDLCGAALDAFLRWNRATGGPETSREESLVDLMLLAICLRRYGGAALACGAPMLHALILLHRLRGSHPACKERIDETRGRLIGRFLSPRVGLPAPVRPGASDLARLLLWMEASGEFRNELPRLRRWQRFWLRRGRLHGDLALAADLLVWFERAARAALGAYTRGVDPFLREIHPSYRGREDELFTGRSEIEYHLNLVGAELYNRALAAEYQRTHRRVVLVPSCMAARGGACKARVIGEDLVCAHCSAVCRLGAIDALGRRHGFRVVLVPHSSGFTRWLRRWQGEESTGLVAVACPLNLLSGGNEIHALGLPAQCVFLDQAGCAKHWLSGTPTSLDEKRLLEVVGAGLRDSAAPSPPGT